MNERDVYSINMDGIFQVEIQVRKIYCINRAVPTLPINLEDAARSEAEFEKAEQVSPRASSTQVMYTILWSSFSAYDLSESYKVKR